MSSQSVRWGILGTGAIAKTFARALGQAQTGELVAVGSRSQASADQFAGEFGGITAHPSYEALLADDNVQAVYIATPHPMHAEWALRATEAGKHVLCEKPMGVNQHEVAAMTDAAIRHGVLLMEAFMYRCHPQTAKLIELIRSGAIGEVRLIQASFGFQAGFNPEGRLFKNDLAGGGIMDVGCYPVSMSRLIAGAALGQPFADPIEVAGSAHLGQTGVDEWAAATLKFPGDIIAQVSTSVSVAQENVVRIFGSGGQILVPNPWTADRQKGGEFNIMVYPKGGEARQERIACDVTAFTLEADVAGRAILAGQHEPESPAMTHADSLGNARTLDRWRQAIGLTYEIEKPTHERHQRPIHGRPLKRREDAPMIYGQVPGLDKQVARFVLGVDNQVAYPHAAIMFDDYFEHGGNAFDTAHVYGEVKSRNLGHWVKSRGVRDQIVIIGKGAHTPNCNPKALTEELLRQLDWLQTDHVDLYFMHRDNPEIPVGEFVDVLNEHVQAGRIKVFGGSNWSIQRMDEANAYAKRKGLQGMTVLSNNFSLARMVDPVWAGCIAASEPEYRTWLERTQTPLFAWSSQARGFFTERADPEADQQTDAELVRCWYSSDNRERRRRAIELAKQKGVLPINIAAAFVLCQPFPTFPLIGPRTPAELRTSLPALNVELTEDELKWLDLEAQTVSA